ncbi:MAG: TonB-dependent receptor [Sphingomonadaceae bacterium]
MSARRPLVALLLASSAYVALPVQAQTVAPEEGLNDEIIVTAQKREESLQDVPISIIALGTRKLDQLNVTSVERVTQLLPSVSIQTTQPGTTKIYMRGIASGGDGNHSGPLPSVGVYLDEQPVTTIIGALPINTYDIARVESLAGPQGTLYGASSQAGTIRIITNKPSTAGFEGRVDGELNTVDEGDVGGRLEGMLNFPLSSNAALRVVGFYKRDAGYIDNVSGTRSFRNGTGTGGTPADFVGGITVDNAAFVENNFNATDTFGGRAALKIDLDDNWTITPTGIYQELRSRGVFGYQPSAGDLSVQRFYPDFSRDRFWQAALTIEGRIGNWDVTYAGAYLERKFSASTDYTDYAEAYDSLYESAGGIAGYFGFVNGAGQTIDPRQFVTSNPKYTKLSQEFRVASPTEERFRVIAGAFYQRQTNDIDERYNVPGLAADASVNGLPGILWLTKQKRVDVDYAVFGEAAFDITPQLTLTAGGRGFIYDNNLIGFFGFGSPSAVGGPGVGRCFVDAAGNLLPSVIAPGPCPNLGTQILDVNGLPTTTVIPKIASGQGFTHRVNLTFKPTDGVLLYGTWSRGFRPGGINRRAGLDPYGADFLTNYELGAKLTFLGGRLRLNSALYQQEWKQFQFAFLGQNSFTQIQNGPNARIRGIEVDVNFVPVTGLTLTAAGAYNDAKTTTNLCFASSPAADCGGAANIQTPTGTQLPITPKFKVNGTARYEFDVGTNTKAHVQAIGYHASSAPSDLRPAFAAVFGRLQSYTYADFAAGLDFGQFSLEAFVNNAFDERAEVSRGTACSVCTRVYVNTVIPRTIGLRAGTKF